MLTWVSVEARTGEVIADLPDLTVDRVAHVICTHSTASATLPLPTAPENWERATLAGGACLVLLDDAEDGTAPVPIWGGLITRRTRTHGDTVDLSLATVEAYLDRRYVGDVTYTATGQNAIVANLVATFVADSLPITVVQLDGAGAARDRAYLDRDDKTVLSVLSELSGVIGGPEWTIEWQAGTLPSGAVKYVPVMYVGTRVGTSPMAGLSPAATFEMPGSVSSVQFAEDFSAGKGATAVMATSTANGDTRPQSPEQTSGDLERPTFEYRWSPSTSITDVATLTSHAQSALVVLANGARSLALVSDYFTGPRVGRDWFMGDDIGYKIGGESSALDNTVPGFPGGLSGSARVIGWEMTLGETPTITPILASTEWGA